MLAIATDEMEPPRRTLRSIGAVLIGLIFIFVLSLATDQLLHSLNVYPPWGEPMWDNKLNLLALSYRVVYAIIGSYLTARFAPRNPMRHAMILGLIGLVLSSIGAIGAIVMANLWSELVPDPAGADIRSLRLDRRATFCETILTGEDYYMATRKAGSASGVREAKPVAPQDVLDRAMAELKRHGTKATVEGMARYGITAKKAFGVTMAQMKSIAQEFPRDHELALALWKTEWYEARMLASMVDDPAKVTPAQMERWCRDFDSWAICDTVCFKLFDQSPHAWAKVWEWSESKKEFILRAAFALLACLALHDKKTADEPFLETLALIERSSTDERNFVKKGVSWALRAIGGRSKDLHAASLALSRQLASSPNAAARWIGKDAMKDLSGRVAKDRVARKENAREEIGVKGKKVASARKSR
jgi:3-methyladenine DNA glycosylase AlkD